jgi:hypothetical protein
MKNIPEGWKDRRSDLRKKDTSSNPTGKEDPKK